jgi:CheY-like chemotaxis protein
MSATNQQKKVFLIEDNRTEGMLLKLSLGSIESIKVTSFITGKDLLDNLSQNPDIVIADLMLPDIDGYDLIKLIKNYNKNIRIVVVSAQKDVELIAKIQEQGVFNYLVKSEACIKYLQQVIEELIIVINTSQKKS